MVRELKLSAAVTSRVNVLVCRSQIVVHLNAIFSVEGYASRLEAETFDIWHSTDGKENSVDHKLSRFAVLLEYYADHWVQIC